VIPGYGGQPTARSFLQGAKVPRSAQVSPSQHHPTGNGEPGRCRRTLRAEWFWREDGADREEAPAELAVRAAPADWDKRGYRHATPGYRNSRESGQTLEDHHDAA